MLSFKGNNMHENNTGHLINNLHGLLYMVWTPKIVLEQKIGILDFWSLAEH